MNQVLTLLRKEFGLYLQDKPGILLTFLVPFVLIYIFGSIFGGSNDGGMGAKIKLAVMDASTTQTGVVLVEALQAEDGLNVITAHQGEEGKEEPFTAESIRQGIVDRDYNFAVIIPEDVVNEEGIGLRVDFLSNPRNQIESQMVNGLLQKAVFTKMPQLLAPQVDAFQAEAMGGDAEFGTFQDKLADLVNESIEEPEFQINPGDLSLSALIDQFNAETAGSGANSEDEEGSASDNVLGQLIEIREDQVYGKEVKNPHLTRMIGGYAIMFLLFATTASAASLFEERNEGLFLRLLSMPVKRTHILWSKFLFNLVLGIVQVMALFLASTLFFDVDVFSNFGPLLVVCLFSAAACTSFGMLLSAFANTPQQAQSMGTLLILGMTAMSGAWIPMQFMPEAMQFIGKLTPVYWSIEGFSVVLWQGGGLLAVAPVLGVISLYAVVLMSISVWRFRTGDLFN